MSRVVAKPMDNQAERKRWWGRQGLDPLILLFQELHFFVVFFLFSCNHELVIEPCQMFFLYVVR